MNTSVQLFSERCHFRVKFTSSLIKHVWHTLEVETFDGEQRFTWFQLFLVDRSDAPIDEKDVDSVEDEAEQVTSPLQQRVGQVIRTRSLSRCPGEVGLLSAHLKITTRSCPYSTL